MIFTYGVTVCGPSHEAKGEPCQDAHETEKLPDGVAIGVVADGLGSEKHSGMASALAARIVASRCAERVKADTGDEDVLRILCEAFRAAQSEIEAEAEKNDFDLDQCDTTLTAAALIDGRLYYGHSGDGGIVALTEDGFFEKVTEQQRDDLGRVFPLYFGEEKWVFGKFPRRVAGVLLATDGLWETFCPIWLRDEPVALHIALLRFFLDKEGLERDGERATETRIRDFVAGIPADKADDDKTVVALLDGGIPVAERPSDYYAEPDWDALKEKWRAAYRKKAYPHLFPDENPE
jgi:serine/threonine protein phosphatase PrpC